MKFSHTSYCSFYNQFQMIWFGIPMAVVPLVFFLSLSVIAFIILVWVVITVYAFKSNTVEKFTNRLINKLTKHNSDKPKNYVLKKMKIHTYIYFLLYWFFMSISLFFVLLSLDIGKNAFIQSFIFPLSGIIGNMAVVFPAGIGIKEGLMSTYFSLFSIPIGSAITIAVTHRMILVVSDMVLFILAYVIYLTKKEYLLDKQMKN